MLGHHPSPVMPVMLYQPYKIGDFSRLAFNRKLAVVVVGAPATPVNYPRIRFCVSAAHSREDLADALAAISDIADELSIKFKVAPPNAWCPGSIHDKEEKEKQAAMGLVLLRRHGHRGMVIASVRLDLDLYKRRAYTSAHGTRGVPTRVVT